MTITKLQRVECLDTEMLNKGIVAFQLVKVDYSFYGNEMSDTFDTKIMKDGTQILINGNGFIKEGTKI